ncbi:hypothetical protein ACFXTI_005587 [Malus domestica]
MRHIPSKLFQSKWRTTLVSTSHRVDERPCTTDDFGEPALARTKMQRASDKVSRSRTRVDEEPLQQPPGKQPLDQLRTKRSSSVHSRLGARDNVYSSLSARMSMHSRLGPRTNIHSRLGSHSDSQHE